MERISYKEKCIEYTEKVFQTGQLNRPYLVYVGVNCDYADDIVNNGIELDNDKDNNEIIEALYPDVYCIPMKQLFCSKSDVIDKYKYVFEIKTQFNIYLDFNDNDFNLYWVTFEKILPESIVNVFQKVTIRGEDLLNLDLDLDRKEIQRQFRY